MSTPIDRRSFLASMAALLTVPLTPPTPAPRLLESGRWMSHAQVVNPNWRALLVGVTAMSKSPGYCLLHSGPTEDTSKPLFMVPMPTANVLWHSDVLGMIIACPTLTPGDILRFEAPPGAVVEAVFAIDEDSLTRTGGLGFASLDDLIATVKGTRNSIVRVAWMLDADALVY